MDGAPDLLPYPEYPAFVLMERHLAFFHILRYPAFLSRGAGLE
jgi:hypothetical protein